MAKEMRNATIHPGMRYLRHISGLKEHLSELSGMPVNHLVNEKAYGQAAAIIREKFPEDGSRVRLIPERGQSPRLTKLIASALKGRAIYAKELPEEFAKEYNLADRNAIFGLFRRPENSPTIRKQLDSLQSLQSMTSVAAKKFKSSEQVVAFLQAAAERHAAERLATNKDRRLEGLRPQKRVTTAAEHLLEPTITYAIADARSAAQLAHYIGVFRGKAPAVIEPLEHKNILMKTRRATGVHLDQKYLWSRKPEEQKAMADFADYQKRNYLTRYVPGEESDKFISAILMADEEKFVATVLMKDHKVQSFETMRNTIPAAELDKNEHAILRSLVTQTPSLHTRFPTPSIYHDPAAKQICQALKGAKINEYRLNKFFFDALEKRSNAHANFAIGQLRADAPSAVQDLTVMMAKTLGATKNSQLSAFMTSANVDRPERYARVYAAAPIVRSSFNNHAEKTRNAISQAKPIDHIVTTFFDELYGTKIQPRTAQTMARLAVVKDVNPAIIAHTAEKFHQGSPKSPALTLKEAKNIDKAILGSTLRNFRDTNYGSDSLTPLQVTRIATGLRDTTGRIEPLSTNASDAIKWIHAKIDAVLEAPDAVKNTTIINIAFPEGRRQAGLERLGNDWHRSINRLERSTEAFESETRLRQKERLSAGQPVIAENEFYPHIISGPITKGDITITPLASVKAYLDESTLMDHCVGSYREDGASGKMLAFHVESPDGKSTPGYYFHPAQHPDQEHRFQLCQHTGEHNDPFPSSHTTAIKELIAETLKNRPLLDEIGAQQTRLSDYLISQRRHGFDSQSKQEVKEFAFEQLKEFLPRNERAMTLTQWTEHCGASHKRLMAKEKVILETQEAQKLPAPALARPPQRQAAGMER